MFNWWEIVAMLFAATTCILVILYSVRKNKTKISFKKDNKILTLSSNETNKATNFLKGCEDNLSPELIQLIKFLGINKTKDFTILMRKTLEYSDKKSKIEKSIMQDQMNSAELKFKIIETVVNKIFMDLMLQEYGRNVNLTNEISFIIFHNGIKVSLIEALRLLKLSFRENHFLDKNEHEFEDYCKEQAESLYYNWQIEFDTQYTNVLIPSPENLKSKINKNVIIGIIQDAFKSAREIAEIKTNILKKLEEDFDSECKNFAGADLNI